MSVDRIRFTVVSEPPEEEEQERECEDVGVAFLRINKILEQQQDLTEAVLDGQCLTHTHTHVLPMLTLCVCLQCWTWAAAVRWWAA